MSTAPAPARIDGIVARDADVAVVFRRGPSKQTQLLRWNLATDEIQAGQWIGGRVYTRRCDLSPDGELLVGAFTNYSTSQARQRAERGEPSFEGWTAVSRPPYFTALAVWEGLGAWNGGGVWRDSRHLALNLPAYRDPHQVGNGLAVEPLGLHRSEDEPIYSMRLESHGWVTVRNPEWRETNPEWRERARALSDAIERGVGKDPSTFDEMISLMENTMPVYETVEEGRMERVMSGGLLVRETVDHGERWSALDDSGSVRLSFNSPTFGWQWLDLDRRGRVIYADKGCLWAWADFPNGDPQMVADLNANVFEPVAPPDWARQWPSV